MTLQTRATTSTTRAAEKILCSEFFKRHEILQTRLALLLRWQVIQSPVASSSVRRGASIYVNFGCPNDVFLPKVFHNRALAHCGGAQTISLSVSPLLRRDNNKTEQAESRPGSKLLSGAHHRVCRHSRVLYLFKAEGALAACFASRSFCSSDFQQSVFWSLLCWMRK